jgi:hypothetical protein
MAKSGARAAAVEVVVAAVEVIEKSRGGKQVVLDLKRAAQFSAAKSTERLQLGPHLILIIKGSTLVVSPLASGNCTKVQVFITHVASEPLY